MKIDIILFFVLLVSFLSPQLVVLVNIIALAPVLISAIKALKNKEVTVDLLAVVALIFAFIAREWYSALFINLMLTSARIFSTWTQNKTESAIKSLLKYRPASIKVKIDGSFVFKKPEEIKVGEIMIVGVGERIATDGVVVKGSSAIDESALTGESIPRTVGIGASVYSSGLNTADNLEIKSTKKESESTLSKIILATQAASLQKSKTILSSSRFASWYISLTFLGSILLYWVTKNTDFVLSILLVVCADDLAVSIPLAFTLAIAKSSQKGIIINNSEVLENLHKVKYFVTDKTGTVTKGVIHVNKIVNRSKLEDNFIYSILNTLESVSTHPVSVAISKFAKSKKASLLKPQKITEYPGEGVEMLYEGKIYMVGKPDFFKTKKIISTADRTFIKNTQDSGFSVSLLSQSNKVIAFIIFEDEIKSYVKDVILKTEKMGVIKWIMLTGDNEQTAKRIARESGIDEYKFGLKPIQKLEYIKNLKQREKKLIGMVGDGVNDAPALSLADVSIAMGSMGSDAAIQVSDIAIMNDDLKKIPQAMSISLKVKKLVSQNVLIWGATNLVGLGLVLVGFLGPTGAATYNFVTDFITAINVFWVLRD